MEQTKDKAQTADSKKLQVTKKHFFTRGKHFEESPIPKVEKGMKPGSLSARYVAQSQLIVTDVITKAMDGKYDLAKSRVSHAPMKQRLVPNFLSGNPLNGSHFIGTRSRVLKRDQRRSLTQLASQENVSSAAAPAAGFNPSLVHRDFTPVSKMMHLSKIHGDFSELSSPSILSELVASPHMEMRHNTAGAPVTL